MKHKDIKADSKALQQLKMETARELGIDLSSELSFQEVGKLGGNMVKKMTEQYKQNQMK